MSGMIELTAYSGKFLGPIAKVLGWIMSGIYDIVLKISGGTINSVPLAIVLMTILIYMCLAIDNPAAEILETFAENAAGIECDP